MSIEVDNLTAAVAKVRGAKDSAIALIKTAAQYIKDHASDPAALKAFADELNSDATEIGDAVAANPLPTPTP